MTSDSPEPAGFTAALLAGGYGLPEPDASGHLGHSHGSGGVSTSVRTAVHNGHEIRIETTYAITIDGKPLEGGVEVLNNGAVHYHGLPNYALPSAIEMCKRVLDFFGTEPPGPDDLGCACGDCEHDEHTGNAATHDHAAPTPRQPDHDGHEHEHAGHDHDHTGHDHHVHGEGQ